MRESMAHVSPIFERLRSLTGFPNASIRVAVNIAPACLSRRAFMNAKKWLAISVLFVLGIGPSGALQGQTQQQTQTTSSGTQTNSSTGSNTSTSNQQAKTPSKPKAHTYTNSAGQRVQSPTQS